ARDSRRDARACGAVRARTGNGHRWNDRVDSLAAGASRARHGYRARDVPSDQTRRGNPMKASFSQALFQELPIVGILRGFTSAQTTEIVRAAIRGGLRNIEITMNTPDAARQIREAATLA